MILKDKIPAIYHRFFPELLYINFASERIATCTNCTLCRSPHSPYLNTKCCAYHPHLSNYLIGAILKENKEDLSKGKSTLRAQIRKKIGVTPYGIIPPLAYASRQKEINTHEFWSRPKELLENQKCPYYNDGHCSIWKYRENLCVTFFCSSDGGKRGSDFWKKLNLYIKMAETSLSQFAMFKLGWSPAKIKTEKVTTKDFNLEDDEGNIIEGNYNSLWGKWVGKEEEFYIKCYEIVKKVDANLFKQITGLKQEILEASIIETQKEFVENVLPEKLKLHPDIVIVNAGEELSRLSLGKISANIPTVILPIIKAFNGKRTTVEVFHLGYKVLFNLSETVDELISKGILISV